MKKKVRLKKTVKRKFLAVCNFGRYNDGAYSR